jgi:hypothetical protein
MTERVLRFSQRGYYLSFLMAVVAVIAGYFAARFVHFDKSSESGIALQSLVFILLLSTLPGILWWFHRLVERLKAKPDAEKERTYKQMIAIRLLVVDFNIVLNILLFFLFSDKSFFMCTAIAAIILLFCRPNKQNIESDLSLVVVNEEEEAEEDETNKQ